MIGHLCLYEVQNVALLCSNSYENVSTGIGHASFMGSFIKCNDDENNKQREDASSTSGKRKSFSILPNRGIAIFACFDWLP